MVLSYIYYWNLEFLNDAIISILLLPNVFKITWVSDLPTLSAPDDDYSRNASCAISLIYVFITWTIQMHFLSSYFDFIYCIVKLHCLLLSNHTHIPTKPWLHDSNFFHISICRYRHDIVYYFSNWHTFYLPICTDRI